MDWIKDHFEWILIIFGWIGTVFALIFRYKYKIDALEKILLDLQCDLEVHFKESKPIDGELLLLKNQVVRLEEDVEKMELEIGKAKNEVLLEMSKMVNQVLDTFREYMRRNDSEVERLRNRHHELVSKEFAPLMLQLDRYLRKVNEP